MWRSITLRLFFMASLLVFALAGCASSPYPPTVHYGVNVNYGSYWGYDRRDYHHHHYRPPPPQHAKPPGYRPPNRPKPPNRPPPPRPRPRPRPSRR
jgi:hypothetical protein